MIQQKIGAFWWLLLPVLCLIWGSNSYHRPEIVEKVERLVYDRHLGRLDAPRVTPEIVLVMAGEASLSRLGRWPWTRSVHAGLLDRLSESHTVVLDILFPESGDPPEDRALAAAAKRTKNLVLAMHMANSTDAGTPRILPPFPLLHDVSKTLGFTNMETDSDGLVRYCRPYRDIAGQTIPSLPLAAARAIMGEPSSFGKTAEVDVLKKLGQEELPVDSDGKLWINHGKSDATQYEYWQVLTGDVPKEVFKNKVVIVGVSAPGIEDYFKIPSPSGGLEISGAQLNYNIIQSLLTGKVPRRVPQLLDAALALIMVLCGAALTLIRRPMWNFVAMTLVTVAFFLLHQYLFVSTYTYTAFLLPVSGMVASFALFLFLKLKHIHHVAEIKTMSLSSIIGLPGDLGDKFKAYDDYLISIWGKVQRSTGMHLLLPQTTWDQIETSSIVKTKPERPIRHDNVILVEDRKGPYPYLAMIPVSPLQRSEEQTYTLLGWNRRLAESHIQAVVAVVLSTAWYFERLQQAEAQQELLLDTIHAISAAIDAKDPVTGGHSNRVSILAKQIAVELNLNKQAQDDIRLGALIHDIGKIGVPDNILGKNGRLTHAEMEKIRSHPSVGKQIMASVKLPKPVAKAVYEHHERYNGTGYPLGLRGDQIDLAGRIIAVADVFDALISDRPYRDAWPLEKALSYMQSSADIDFDGDVVRALCRVVTLKGAPVSGHEPVAMAS